MIPKGKRITRDARNPSVHASLQSSEDVQAATSPLGVAATCKRPVGQAALDMINGKARRIANGPPSKTQSQSRKPPKPCNRVAASCNSGVAAGGRQVHARPTMDDSSISTRKTARNPRSIQGRYDAECKLSKQVDKVYAASPGVEPMRGIARVCRRPAAAIADERSFTEEVVPEPVCADLRVRRHPAASVVTKTKAHRSDESLGPEELAPTLPDNAISYLHTSREQLPRQMGQTSGLAAIHGARPGSDKDDLPPVQSLLSAVEPFAPYSFPTMGEMVPEEDADALPWDLGLAGVTLPATVGFRPDDPSLDNQAGMPIGAVVSTRQGSERQEGVPDMETVADQTSKTLREALEKEVFLLDVVAKGMAPQNILHASRIEARADLAVTQAEASHRELSQGSMLINKLSQQVAASERALKKEMQQAELNQESWEMDISMVVAELSIAKAKSKQAQKLVNEEQAAIRFKEAVHMAETRLARRCEQSVESLERSVDETIARARREAQAVEEKAAVVAKEVAIQVEIARVDAGSRLKTLLENVTDIEMTLPDAIKIARASKELNCKDIEERLEQVRCVASGTVQDVRSRAQCAKKKICEKFDAVEQSLASAQLGKDRSVRDALTAKKEVADTRIRLQDDVANELRRFNDHVQSAMRNNREQIDHARSEILQARREFDDADRNIEQSKRNHFEWSALALRRAEEHAATITGSASKTESMARDTFTQAQKTTSAAEAHAIKVGKRTEEAVEKQFCDERKRLTVAKQTLERHAEFARSHMQSKSRLVAEEVAEAQHKVDQEIAGVMAHVEKDRAAWVSRVSNAGYQAQLAIGQARAAQAEAERSKEDLEDLEKHIGWTMKQRQEAAIAQLKAAEVAKIKAIEIAESQRAQAEQHALHAERIAGEKMIVARETIEQEARMTEELKNRSERQVLEITTQCQMKQELLMKEFVVDEIHVREKANDAVATLEQNVLMVTDQVTLLKEDGQEKVNEERQKAALEKNDATRCEVDMLVTRQRAAIAAQSVVNADSAAKAREEELADVRAEAKLASQQQDATLVSVQHRAASAAYQANLLKARSIWQNKEKVASVEQKAKAEEELAKSLEQQACLAKASAAKRKQQAEEAKEKEVVEKEEHAMDLERVAKRAMKDSGNAHRILKTLFGNAFESGHCKKEVLSTIKVEMDSQEEAPLSGDVAVVVTPASTHAKRLRPVPSGEPAALTPANSHAKRHKSVLSCESAAPTPCLPAWSSLRASIKETLHGTSTPTPRAQRRMTWSRDVILCG